ncbi:MAG TPA: LysM peptidoglycan-binding domain-containing protein [Anaerolineales bacterium]
MRRWKRLIYYLIINVLVSACTVLVVLNVWARTHPPGGPTEEPLAQVESSATPGFSPTSGIGSGGEPENPGPISEEPDPNPTNLPDTDAESSETEYRVQPGDTLGAIAVRFNLSVSELMEANDLTDPDRLEVGQTLTIPASEVAQATHTALPEEEVEPVEPAATPRQSTATPPAVTGEPKVVIDSVVGAGDLDSERVLLKRTGAGELSLAGWQLLADGGRVFTFPQLTLFEGAMVNLYTQAGQGTVFDLYWGLEAPVWKSGAEIVLKDDQGEVHATYQVP